MSKLLPEQRSSSLFPFNVFIAYIFTNTLTRFTYTNPFCWCKKPFDDSVNILDKLNCVTRNVFDMQLPVDVKGERRPVALRSFAFNFSPPMIQFSIEWREKEKEKKNLKKTSPVPARQIRSANN